MRKKIQKGLNGLHWNLSIVDTLGQLRCPDYIVLEVSSFQAWCSFIYVHLNFMTLPLKDLLLCHRLSLLLEHLLDFILLTGLTN